MAKLCRFLPLVVPKRWNKWASWEVSYNTEEAECPPWALLSHWRSCGLEKPPWCSGVTAWERWFLLPFWHSPPWSVLSGRYVCLIFGLWDFWNGVWSMNSWQVVFFVMGTEVGNGLCHHLDDVTSLNFYIGKKERFQINNLSFYLKKVEKEEKIKFQRKQRKHNSKNLHRHQWILLKKSIQNNNKTRSWFFEKSNKIAKT